ncbi:MAG: hypothetical protein IMW91_07500 [Firmicutes bacterium]|nr:hypothetical protein [Bacillota bacterium]
MQAPLQQTAQVLQEIADRLRQLADAAALQQAQALKEAAQQAERLAAVLTFNAGLGNSDDSR